MAPSYEDIREFLRTPGVPLAKYLSEWKKNMSNSRGRYKSNDKRMPNIVSQKFTEKGLLVLKTRTCIWHDVQYTRST